MMTKSQIRRYALAVFVLFTANAISSVAQIDNYKRSIVFWGASGYSALMHDAPKTETTGGLGLNLGAGYEFDYKNLMMQAGVELSHYSSYMQMNDSLDILSMFDTEGYAFDGYYTFRHTRDLQSVTSIGFPLMFGYQSVSGFYFLAGGKIKLHLTGNSKVRTMVTSKAHYINIIGDNYDGFFSDMPNHGLYTELRYVNTPLAMNVLYMGSFEAGTYLTKNRYFSPLRNTNIDYRLSLFCDYGFSRIKEENKVNDIIVNTSNTGEYVPGIRGYLYYNVKSNVVNTLFIGVKLTILFNHSKDPDCNCNF